MLSPELKFKLGNLLTKVMFFGRLGKLGKNSMIHRSAMVSGAKNLFIGNTSTIYPRAQLEAGGKIIIGDNCTIAHEARLVAGADTIIKIGNNSIIGPRSMVFTFVNHYEPGKIIQESFKKGDVIIEDDVFIGAGVIILPGVKISSGAIVGAGELSQKIYPLTRSWAVYLQEL